VACLSNLTALAVEALDFRGHTTHDLIIHTVQAFEDIKLMTSRSYTQDKLLRT